jgi:acyl carrier protein
LPVGGLRHRRWPTHPPTHELLDILHEIADIDPANALDDKSYVEDLNVDSLTTAEVIASLEYRFDFSIPEPDAATLSTVGDTVAYLDRRLAEQSDVAVAIGD